MSLKKIIMTLLVVVFFIYVYNDVANKTYCDNINEYLCEAITTTIENGNDSLLISDISKQFYKVISKSITTHPSVFSHYEQCHIDINIELISNVIKACKPDIRRKLFEKLGFNPKDYLSYPNLEDKDPENYKKMNSIIFSIHESIKVNIIEKILADEKLKLNTKEQKEIKDIILNMEYENPNDDLAVNALSKALLNQKEIILELEDNKFENRLLGGMGILIGIIGVLINLFEASMRNFINKIRTHILTFFTFFSKKDN